MFARVSFAFVLFLVGSDLETGLIPVQRVVPTVCKIHSTRIIRNGKQARGTDEGARKEEFK
jgi:hypothetical protein